MLSLYSSQSCERTARGKFHGRGNNGLGSTNAARYLTDDHLRTEYESVQRILQQPEEPEDGFAQCIERNAADCCQVFKKHPGCHTFGNTRPRLPCIGFVITKTPSKGVSSVAGWSRVPRRTTCPHPSGYTGCWLEVPSTTLYRCYSPVTSTTRLCYITDCTCFLCPYSQVATLSNPFPSWFVTFVLYSFSILLCDLSIPILCNSPNPSILTIYSFDCQELTLPLVREVKIQPSG